MSDLCIIIFKNKIRYKLGCGKQLVLILSFPGE